MKQRMGNKKVQISAAKNTLIFEEILMELIDLEMLRISCVVHTSLQRKNGRDIRKVIRAFFQNVRQDKTGNETLLKQ